METVYLIFIWLECGLLLTPYCHTLFT